MTANDAAGTTPFHVGLTGDFLGTDGQPGTSDLGLSILERVAGIDYRYLKKGGLELSATELLALDAVIVLSPKVTAQTLEQSQRLQLIARAGVGYDSVDVEACTKAGVILTITPDGVRRPVALAAMTLLLALTHKLLIKDRLTREGRWDERTSHFGAGLVDKVLGVVGFGNIGREVARLGAGLYMRPCAADPRVDPSIAEGEGVRLVTLPTLLREADFVVVCCPLTPATFHLIDRASLASMKATAYLINVARGPIVDQRALTEALVNRSIAGAGLDVFETEPIDPGDPLLALENVVLTPHSLGWTDDAFRDNGRSACQSVVDVAQGRIPQHIVNPEVLRHPRVRARFGETEESE